MNINKITVLGSGLMGHGIAQVSAMAGYNVAIRDIDQSFLDKAMEKIKWSLNKLVEKNKISSKDAENILARIATFVDLKEALKDCDLVIEAVPEDMNLKKKVYAEVDKLLPEKAVLASNTSTLPITEIAKTTSRPNRFIGIHFFNPPQLMPLVEVIPGAKTDSDLVDATMQYVRKVGKEPILCKKDVAGFIVNRIFIPLVHEAAWSLERDSAKMTEIDAAVKFKLGFPMGIFELADYTGIDVVHKATVEMYSRDKHVINPCPMIEELFNNKNYGQKSGKGFYEYKSGTYERINLTKEEAERYNPARLLAVAVNNASWLLTNDVCSREDVERAMKLGMGLKEGLFSIAERFGLNNLVSELRKAAKIHGSFYEPDPMFVKLAS
ncbi:MAG TPA: 3-hydroxyacyl-CoA dehydrogenase NAD-binding domain-containing protein [Nitrososphaerales archaeon]|nr:3-hydroxyacyl-CoA dehydrogenase NAD-binding domain-containing protein [Nitrososphaerales archaeon]